MFKYKIIAQGFAYIEHWKMVDLILEKTFLFFRQPIPQDHKVYFDLYDKRTGEKVYIWGMANIDQDWIKLGYKKRNQIKNLLENHFKSEFDIWNYRSNFEKKKKKTWKKK